MSLLSGRYAVERVGEPRLRMEAFVLRDLDSGSEARLVPGLGANFYSFRPGLAGRPIEMMLGPEPDSHERPSHRFGNPILFPFPNRVRDGRFTFRGRACQLDLNAGKNAIHGLVSNLPWLVEEAGPTPEGARVRCMITSTLFPDVLRQFPFPFRLEATFTLSRDEVRVDFRARNTGDGPMPMGLGIHPWFGLPLVRSGRREDCLVQVPARRRWILDDDLVPTGNTVEVPPDADFRRLRPIGQSVLDAVYTHLEMPAGYSECVLRDPSAGADLLVRADASFRELVVYAPPSRQTICFEPYTCTTDVFNLQARGVDAGLVVLEPDSIWSGSIWFVGRRV